VCAYSSAAQTACALRSPRKLVGLSVLLNGFHIGESSGLYRLQRDEDFS
jgi:hypothetical protein